MTLAVPSFIGDPPLFSVLHLPADRKVRAGVLLCGSLGKEACDTTRGLRRLADRLAARGIAVLRFDYAGTQDSSGDHGSPTAVADWLASIRAGVEELRRLGLSEIGLIGYRVGALLSSQVAEGIPELTATAWLDPVGEGRRYRRGQGALFSVAMGRAAIPDTGQFCLLGLEMDPAAADALAELTLQLPDGPLLIITRSGSRERRVLELVDQADQVIYDKTDLLRHFATPNSFLVEVPEQLIDRLIDWLAPRFTGELRTVEPGTRTSAEVAGANGILVEERIEKIAGEMFAVRTLPLSDTPQRSVLMFATADDTHHGPGREWVSAARRVAAAGGQALRFDRVGAGESGPVHDGEVTPLYSDAAKVQALAAAEHLAVPGRQVLAVGVCSGSWYAATVARRLELGKALLINAVAWSWVWKRSAHGQVRPEDLGVPRSTPTWQRSPRGRAKAFLQRYLPYPLWRMLGQRGITQVPEVLLSGLLKAGVQPTALLIEADRDWFRSQRGTEGMRRLLRRHGDRAPQIRDLPGDHSAFHPAARAVITAELVDWVQRGIQEPPEPISGES